MNDNEIDSDSYKEPKRISPGPAFWGLQILLVVAVVGLTFYVKRIVGKPADEPRFVPESYAQAKALVGQAGSSGKWTAEQDRELTSKLGDLPLEKQLEVSQNLIKLINTKKVVRVPEPGSNDCAWMPGPHNCLGATIGTTPDPGKPEGAPPAGDKPIKGAVAPEKK